MSQAFLNKKINNRRQKTEDKYFTAEKEIFSKPQIRHFNKMLNGRIEDDARHTISSLNASQADTRDVSNDIKLI